MRKIFGLSLALALIFGCGDSRDKTVFLVINGKPLTADEVKTAVLIEAKIRELAGSPVPGEKFEKWANSTAMRLVGPLANQILIEEEIEKAGVELAPEDEQAVLASYNRRTRSKAKSKEALTKRFAPLQDAFLAQFDKAVRLAAYERKYWRGKVTDEAVAQYFHFKTNELFRAQRINDEALKKANRACARLKAGEPWDKVAAACSEDKLISPANERNAKQWRWMGADGMGNANLAAALSKLDVGAYSEPVETDEGLLIVKVVEKRGRLCHVARILFRMARAVVLPKNADEAREQIARQRVTGEKERALKRLEDAAKFEYPLGTNFTYKIWKDEAKKR